MIELTIILAAVIIADAIMFVHRYKGFFYGAKTEQEKEVRRKWFESRSLEWDGKQ